MSGQGLDISFLIPRSTKGCTYVLYFDGQSEAYDAYSEEVHPSRRGALLYRDMIVEAMKASAYSEEVHPSRRGAPLYAIT